MKSAKSFLSSFSDSYLKLAIFICLSKSLRLVSERKSEKWFTSPNSNVTKPVSIGTPTNTTIAWFFAMNSFAVARLSTRLLSQIALLRLFHPLHIPHRPVNRRLIGFIGIAEL